MKSHSPTKYIINNAINLSDYVSFDIETASAITDVPPKENQQDEDQPDDELIITPSSPSNTYNISSPGTDHDDDDSYNNPCTSNHHNDHNDQCSPEHDECIHPSSDSECSPPSTRKSKSRPLRAGAKIKTFLQDMGLSVFGVWGAVKVGVGAAAIAAGHPIFGVAVGVYGASAVVAAGFVGYRNYTAKRQPVLALSS